MNNQLTSLPGYRICQYKLVIVPHEDLGKKIAKVKAEFAEKYEASTAVIASTQIVLATFSQLHMMEERVINRLKIIGMALPAFKVELKDFGSFPTHTIYINVETKTALQLVVKHLKTAQALLKTKEEKPHFMNDFFISVARKLLPWQYEKSWAEYDKKQFTGRFIASSMLLMRRYQGEQSYKPIGNFQFMNMPVLTTQATLF